MEVRLLKAGYKNNHNFFHDFLNGTLEFNNEYFSNKIVYIDEAPDFPIYMAKGTATERRENFLTAFKIVSQSYLGYDRELIFNEIFWHSLLVTHKRDFILKEYPEIYEDQSKFKNIVLKPFDWENYIYKVIVGAQYIYDNVTNPYKHERYHELIIDNLDVYNYIIKYEVFRNDKFLINILDIIDELDISQLLKAKIKGREDLGDDERYGRRVLFEFNKSYPIVMAPMLEKEQLKEFFLEYLGYYYDINLNAKEEIASTEIVLSNSVEQIEIETGNKNDYDIHYSDENNKFQENSENFNQVMEEGFKNEYGKFDLHNYLDRCELEYIDHRDKGGSIWVIGSKNIEVYLKSLKEKGFYFRYKPVGGRVSKGNPAWFWYDKDE